MKEILVINPRRKKRRLKKRRTVRSPAKRRRTTRSTSKRRRTTKRSLTANPKRSYRRKGVTMAARKRKRRRTPTRTIVRAAAKRRRAPARRNPSRARSAARRAGGALRGLFTARNIIDSAKATGGMLATQFFAKRFADGGGANDAEWTWKNYTWGAAGAVLSGLGAELIKAGSGKEFFKGGMSLLMYKLVVNELSQKSAFVSEYFGEAPAVFLGEDGNTYEPGDTYLGDDGEVYLMGSNGNWLPTGQQTNPYYGPESVLGGELMPPTSLGGELEPPTSALGVDPYAQIFG